MIGPLKSSARVLTNITKTWIKPNIFTQPNRTAVILRRMYPIRLYPKGGKPHKMRHRDFIYELVEDLTHKPQPVVDMILTQYIEGVGEKGDRITKKHIVAYRDYLLPGLAIYASPENIEKYKNIGKEEKTHSSKIAPMTVKKLSGYTLNVLMSVEEPWTLEKWHIRTNLRCSGIHATDESITLPDKEIKGPNMDYEGKCFYITLTINKTESVKVRCRLHHHSADISKQLDPISEPWKLPVKAIFEEDQEVLDSLPVWEGKKKKAAVL